MGSSVALQERAPAARPVPLRTLYVAWQDPGTHRILPVGRLRIVSADDSICFEFRYLAAARDVLARPFVAFPSFSDVYSSPDLFPFFENRMIPTARPDFEASAESVGLAHNSDPFEVLAFNGGRRATDTLEIFPEPEVDRDAGTASVHFLVRGIRHRDGAQDAIDELRVGDPLMIRPEPDNPFDQFALLITPQSGQPIGWVPAYLCDVLHRSMGAPSDWSAISCTVRHVGDRSGPAHFRLLCEAVFAWPFTEDPFDTPAFGLMSNTEGAA